MPKIVIPESVDKKLEDLAPQFIKGRRNIGRRVLWAIGEFLEGKDQSRPARENKRKKAG